MQRFFFFFKASALACSCLEKPKDPCLDKVVLNHKIKHTELCSMPNTLNCSYQNTKKYCSEHINRNDAFQIQAS